MSLHSSAHPYHPYSANQASEAPQLASINAAAPQSTLLNLHQMGPHGYGGGYECGLPSNWSGWSGGCDSVLSSPSSTPDTTGGMDMALMMMSPGGRSELPDDLSDFILEYSRRYSPILSRKTSYSDGGSPRSSTTAADSPCGGESPLSAPQRQANPSLMAKIHSIFSFSPSSLFQICIFAQFQFSRCAPRRCNQRAKGIVALPDLDNDQRWQHGFGQAGKRSASGHDPFRGHGQCVGVDLQMHSGNWIGHSPQSFNFGIYSAIRGQ